MFQKTFISFLHKKLHAYLLYRGVVKIYFWSQVFYRYEEFEVHCSKMCYRLVVLSLFLHMLYDIEFSDTLIRLLTNIASFASDFINSNFYTS
jgi:hypothetical protein